MQIRKKKKLCPHKECFLLNVFGHFDLNNFFNEIIFNFQHWELIVLSRLKWDISSITPLDFLELLLSRLPITHRNCTDINLDKIRKHAQAFISLAARGEQKKN